MRKTVFTLMLLWMTFGLHAGPVTPEKALRIAEKVFASQPYNNRATQGKLDIVWDGEFEATKADLDPAFYVVGREGGGFVMVSGNDNVRPVLALSYDNPFVVEGMPENVRFWMERIKAYSRGATLATPDVVAQWNEFEDTKSTVISSSLTDEYNGSRTVEWNQDDPANLKCPVVTGESVRAVCGCVALAMSEIMTWYGYPDRGEGTVPQYTYKLNNNKSFTVPSHDLGTTYDWAGLQSLKTPEQFYAEANTELGQNLGQLVYDVGTILQLSYSYAYETGGNLDLYPRFAEMMGYSKNAVEQYRDYGFSDYQWDQMLKEQVRQRPVYYSGYDSGRKAGHAYVVDGYATYKSRDLVFHFNFGWAGICNGYYYSDYQNVRDSNYGVSKDYQGMSALFDFVPDPSGSSTPVLLLGYYSDGGMKKETNDDNTVSFTAYNVMNMGSDDFVGRISLVWEYRNGTQEIIRSAVASADSPIELHAGFSYGVSFNLSGIYYEFGEKLAYYYQPEGGEYKKVSFVDPSIGLDEIPLMPAACILTKTSYSKGEFFYFRLTNHDYTYSDATWTITDPSGKTTSYSQSADKVALSKSGKYKITATTSNETLVAFIKVN